MALKTYKPSTPAQRQLVTVDRSDLWAGRPVKALVACALASPDAEPGNNRVGDDLGHVPIGGVLAARHGQQS